MNHKIVIVGDWCPDDEHDLYTVAMEVDGLRVMSLLVLSDVGTNGSTDEDKETNIESFKSELYSDMYDEDDLTIKSKEVIDGNDAIKKLAKYINKHWDEDLQVMYYKPDKRTFDKLKKKLVELNGRIYLADYNDIFSEYHDNSRPIIDVMKDQGLKTENLLQDSQISFVYFLVALAYRLETR